MESLSQITSNNMTADESTRPAQGVCECGNATHPHWMLTRWSPRADVCEECAAAAESAAEKANAAAATEGIAHAVASETARIAPSARSRAMTFDAYEPGSGSQRAAMDAVSGSGSVWLHGLPGCGKTHLATAAALKAVSAGEHVERWLVADLMAKVRTDAMTSGSDMETTVARLSTCDLLVLDDLGVERTTPLALETLYRIVDKRYDYDRRTIVTSNAAPSSVARSVGARVHSRLVGMCRVVRIDGSDWRLR